MAEADYPPGTQARYKASLHELGNLKQDMPGDPAWKGYARIVSIWVAALDAGALPKRAQLSFRGFSGWHSRMIMSAMEENGDLQFRLVGEDVAQMFGNDVKAGMRFSDLPYFTFEDYADYFRAIRADGVFGRYSGVVPFKGREHKAFDVLDLPARNEAGDVAYLYSFFRPKAAR